ncbi:ras family small GTPase [Naegleria gruberi]|uniref:Ras family small GTPase n=1 Tax=Naegleria gruberi TaxID=5762 RepID=D2V3R1_NAEGR|nr:ras family small GTPase [Naegleria gruberi]EFC48819.1 ras family small GTPase [Naegleria gruberi]|eukprot:XP_002681563.1 ras family small GTPase [Naegleria gruberi strain NEG-M]
MPPVKKAEKKKKEKSKEEVKIVVFGSGGVGKSALIVQIQNVFVEHYDPTLEDSYRKDAIIDKKEVILDILDTAGQEEFHTLRDQYIRQGEGYIIVYSITNRSSFEEAYQFIDHILQTKGLEESEYSNAKNSIAIILVANKSDLESDRAVTKEESTELCQRFGGIQFYEASAKTRMNVEEIFNDCASQVFAKVKKSGGKDEKCLLM